MPIAPKAPQEMGNLLLASLPHDDLARLLPHLSLVELSLDEVIVNPDEPVQHVYFPAGAIISLVSLMENGAAVETGLVGREGVAGLPAFLGVCTTPMRSLVQIAGAAYRLKAGVARAEFERGGGLRTVVNRYFHALFVEISQSAACNRLHHTEGRLARWLLMTSDALDSDSLALTHEFISTMLGIRRAGVTEAAIALRDLRLIDYNRGLIQIIDRPRLQELACECYDVVRREFGRVFDEQ